MPVKPPTLPAIKPVESACKQVVANRMKRSGTIWSEVETQELPSLRTAYLNEQWDQSRAIKPLRKNAACKSICKSRAWPR
jgi:hypothetical protein